MRRSPGLLLAIAVVAMAVVEVTLHWLLGREGFSTIRAIYLATDYPSSKHFFEGVVDNFGPAVILGSVSGWVGFPRWSVRRFSATTIGIAIFIAALMPLYRILIGPKQFVIVWGMPKTALQSILFHLYDILTAFLAAGFFTRAAYVFRRDWKRAPKG